MVFTVFAVKMDGIGEKIEQMLIELKVSNEVKGVSTKLDSLEPKPNNFITRKLTSHSILDKQKRCVYFSCLCVPGKSKDHRA